MNLMCDAQLMLSQDLREVDFRPRFLQNEVTDSRKFFFEIFRNRENLYSTKY